VKRIAAKASSAVSNFIVDQVKFRVQRSVESVVRPAWAGEEELIDSVDGLLVLKGRERKWDLIVVNCCWFI
jgi:hypothetical protein